MKKSLQFAFASILVLLSTIPSQADLIGLPDIVAIPDSATGSGNGTLDLRMFTFSGAEIGNASGSFNGDNGNKTLPQGGGADTGSFAESYFTTAGELQDYYILNFSDGQGGSTVSELAIFFDLNETGATAQANNLLERLDIIINPTSVQGTPDPGQDITGAEQAAIDQTFSGGFTESSLINPVNLSVVQQGAGFADYMIRTGINPFALNSNDTLLFNISMSSLNNGAEEIFLSGEFSVNDLVTIPEPSAGIVLLIGIALFHTRSRRRRVLG